MKTMIKVALAAGVLGCSALWAGADQNGSSAPKAIAPSAVSANEVQLTGTVENVNPLNRDIKVQSTDGNAMNFKVSPEVARLSDIKQGDQVQVNYLEPVAVAFQKSGAGAPAPLAEKTIQVTPTQMVSTGTISGTVTVTTVALNTQVTDLDRQNRTVTLRQPDGTSMTMKVAPDVKGFDQLKIGDTVLAEYTQPLAIDVLRA